MESLIEGPWNTNEQRLRKTFSLALILHTVLLAGLSFTLPAGEPRNVSLEVTLAHHKSDTAPTQADFVAQANQLGSGDQAQTETPQPTTDQLSPFVSQIQGLLPTVEQQLSEPDKRKILSHNGEANKTVIDHSATAPSSNLTNEKFEQQLADSNIGAMRAELDRLKQAYSKLPRVLRMTSVSAKSADEAAYMHYFEQRVEQIGNVHYPHEARVQGIFGRVQLVVVLLADGTVQRVEVSKGSGSRVLDQAAVRSVQLAAPFNPFPKELRTRDEIHIIRTWQYQSNNVLTTN